MRIHIILHEPHSDPQPHLFRCPLVESRLGFLPLAGSTAAHAAATGIIWFVAAHLSGFGNYTVAWQAAYRVDPIRLRVPEPIYYRPAPAPAKRAIRPRPARGRIRPAEPRVGQQEAASAAPAAAPARRPFVAPQIELPAARNVSNEPDVILQPAMPLQAAPPTTTVPALAFWARQTPEVPKPRRREPVIPGRAERPVAPPSLDAPPVLAIPNREPALSDINMALAPYTGPARLTVANSSTTPIRMKNSPGEPQAGSFEMSEGSPVNLIAITAAVRPAGNVIEVPRGVQHVPATGGGNGSEAGAASSDGDPSRGGTGQGRTAGTGAGGTTQAHADQGAGASTGSGSRSGSGPGKGTGSGSNPAQSGTGTGSSRGAPGAGSSSGTGTGSGSGNGAGVGARSGASARPVVQATPENADVTRIVHSANGVFDVVIMQSTVRDDMPETAGLLSGSPVYTVYLRAGDQREWLLEYCIPSAARPQNMYQIDVSDPGEITPPYPMTTVVPNSVWGQRSTRYTVLHGFITAAGRLRNVTTAAGPAPALAGQLLPALPEWQFRPVLQNRKPVEVEILLLIPPRS